MRLYRHILPAALLLCAAAVHAAVPARAMIGTPQIFLPHASPTGTVVLFSSADGWSGAESDIAARLIERGQIVIGIDLAATLRRMVASRGTCATLIGEIEAASHQAQREAGAPAYRFPVLAGAHAGGTMAIEVAGQASTATIDRVLAIDPDPALPGRIPLCPVSPRPAGPPPHDLPAYGLPSGRLPYGVDIRLSAAASAAARRHAAEFAVRHPDARLADAPQATPASALLEGLPAPLAHTGAAGVADLPLVELPVARPGDAFAVLYSGDGGWRDLDKTLAALLQRNGLPVVGVDALRYFWTRRSPEQAAHDLGRIIDAYRRKWGADKVALIGFSFGADVLPALYNRLAAADRAAVTQLSLLGFSATADFEVTVAGWLRRYGSEALPTLPEVRRIEPQRVQCFYGEDDDEAACPQVGNGLELIRTTGGHHFDGDYEALARRILQGLKQRGTP